MSSFWSALALMAVGSAFGIVAPLLHKDLEVEHAQLCQTLGALAGLLLFWRYGARPENYTLLLAIAALIAIALADSADLVVPDPVLLVLLAAGALHIALFCRGVWLAHVGGAAAVFVFMLLVNLISRGALGMGDVKLMAAIALLLGPISTMAALMIGAIPAALYAVWLFIKTRDAKTAFAFAPFLVLGALAMIYLG